MNLQQEKEIENIVKAIVEKFKPLQINCFGSRTIRNFRHSSFSDSQKHESCDYDLLVITEATVRKEHEIQNFVNSIYKSGSITILNHSEETVKAAVVNGNFFISTVLKRGIVSYLSEGFIPVSVNQSAIVFDKESRTRYFERSFKNAWGFIEAAVDRNENEDFNLALFMLHQALEQASIATIRVFLGYRADMHHLGRLVNLCNNFTDELSPFFSASEREGKRLFGVLVKSYNEVRYNVDFSIDEDDVSKLLVSTEKFIEKAEECCKVRLKEYSDLVDITK